MKSGGPWNLRGLRPEAREAARDAARRSGMSVGEWLNTVIRQDDDSDYGEPMPAADFDDDDDWHDEPRRELRHEPRRTRRREYHQHGAEERGPPRRRRRREWQGDLEHEAALARDEFGEVHARLDRLTHQLERLAGNGAPRLTGAPASQPRIRAGLPRRGAPVAANGARTSVDDAVAEINERQRALYGSDLPVPPVAGVAAPPGAMAPAAATFVSDQQHAAEPTLDIANLEDQLRYITTRIEELGPSRELERSVKSFRRDLSDIRQQLTEALPRRAVESLEIEVRALAQRLDHSRKSGVDLGVLAGLERGLNEVRDALKGLTPAESLVGFDDAVKTLAQKVDLIITREDPAALQQLETAIGALRGIVSHVASNDTLTKVAEDVRALASKVDGVANSAASGQAVSALESRIDTLANALNASTEAGQAVPRELEKLLSGLIEKLEWVQLTHTDHAALGALEDRIAQLIKRLDASDARLGNLEAVERGLADLLVHLDQIRGGNSAAPGGATPKPVVVDALARDVDEIRRSERRTQDSLEAVHGAVEHVVDRLAMIESGIHEGTIGTTASETPLEPEPEPAPQAELEQAAKPAPIPEFVPVAAPAAPPPSSQPAERRVGLPPSTEPAARRAGPRPPIDPNLPPDHPLEPGTADGPRAMPSAAERIAASEAAVEFAKPPVIAEPGEKPNFIAAARRAAQTAAATAPERYTRTEGAAPRAPQPQRPSRLRKLLVAGGAVLIAVGFLHVALRMFQDRTAPDNAAPAQQTARPPTVVPQPDSSETTRPSGPLVVPVPGSSSDNGSTSTAPAVPPGPAMREPQSAAPNSSHDSAAPNPVPAAPLPQQQSWMQNYTADITGALPRRTPPPPQAQPPASVATAPPPPASAPAMVSEKLPATIGGPKLRAAAIAGDAAAEFEVANRFAEGRGVPPSNEQALRWLELAAKQGLAPAQFRLGGFYEKGIVVKKNLAVARDFYTAAAAKGNGKAMHNLAVLYAEGIDGPADYRTAALWFRKAADHGIKDSQYNLAILYARGIGVEQNYAESYKWFALAATGGDADAAKKRDEVAAHLDAQAFAAAKLAVQKWTAEPQPEDAIGIKAPPGGWDLPEHAERAKGRAAARPVSLQPKYD